MTTLATVAAGTGAITDINDNFIAASPAAMYGRRASATSGLTWGYYGGIAFGATIANGTVSLTASSTNYIVASRSTGAVSAATSTTDWNNTTDYFRLYQVVAGASTVTSYTDHRDFTGGGTGGGGGASDFTDLGDVPSSYSGAGGQFVKVKSGEDGLEFVSGGGGGAENFTELGDVPSSYAGQSGKIVSVKSGEDGLEFVAAPSGSLSYYTESLTTASPNTTINVAALSVTGGSTSTDAVIAPKGTGAFALRVPDGTTTGGNKRGTRAVDLQINRSDASYVASGQESFAAGNNNTASGANSIAIGVQNVASATRGMAFGYRCTASGATSITLGGDQNTASGIYSATLGGNYLNTRSITGATAFGASGSTVSSSGKRQGELHALACATTSSTPVNLSTNGNASPSSANQLVLNNNSIITVQGVAQARQGTTGDSATWTFTASVKRGANAAATALFGTPTVTLINADSGASAWTLTITADTSLGGIQLTATGENSKTIQWTTSLLASYLEA